MSGWQPSEKCLVRDADHGWATAVVTGSQGIGNDATLKLRLDDGGVLMEKQGCDVERLTNDHELVDTEDMAALENLSEATMLECLRRRYRQDRIYSSLGGIVVAINPFRNIEHLYEDGYAKFGAGDDAKLLQPHPYALAESAVRGVVRDRVSQSLLVSGESGAGKTETVKIMLGYIAKRSHRAKGTSSQPGVDDALIAANPLLEAFANAMTVRNGNSSRFGKFVRVFVDRLSGTVASAQVDHYLLEKTRCVSLNPGERNFHVFYQLVAAKTGDANDRRLLNLGGRTRPPRDVDDKNGWNETTSSMRALNVSPDVAEDIGSTLKGILAVGEASFESVEIPGQDAGSRMTRVRSDASHCLGVRADDLAEAFVARRVAGVRVPNSAKQAEDARDGLLKALYARLFDKIVLLVNAALGADAGPQMGVDDRLFVGLLDIFGFESFSQNSLEQLLINYANERLQAHFNTFVFETEAKLYMEEDIPVPPTAYVDNAGVVASLEDGVLRLLDEECALRRGSDQQFVAKLDRVCDEDVLSKYKGSHRSGGELVGRAFVVRHFAGKVTYTCDGFVAKNRDALPDAGAATLAQSTNPLVASLFANAQNMQKTGARAARRGGRRRECVARAFGVSLRELTRTVESTRPQFVRCVKPNSDQAPMKWRGALVLEQLRYMGLLQVVEARRRGYPRRYSHEAFLRRFSKLVAFEHSADRAGALCLVDALQHKLQLEREAICVGRTKVFLRARAEALLEGARDRTLRASALQELEAAIELENVDALEAAVAIATELRLDGAVLNKARSRVAVLRFRKHSTLFKEIIKHVLPDMAGDLLKDIHKTAGGALDDAARVAKSVSSAAWSDPADVDTFTQILRRLRRKLRKLEGRIAAAAALEKAAAETMEACGDLASLSVEDAPRVLENLREELEAAHRAAEEAGVPPQAPEALVALRAADALGAAFDTHATRVSEEQAEAPWGSEEAKGGEEPASPHSEVADLDEVPAPPIMKPPAAPPPAIPPPAVTMTPPSSAHGDDDVQVVIPKPPAYADEARPATWLSDAERHLCQALSKNVAASLVGADDAERRARALALERPAVKLQKNGGSAWKAVAVSWSGGRGGSPKLVWRPQKSGFSPLASSTKLALKDIERVCLGPEAPRRDGEGGVVDEYHARAPPSNRAASRWHYVTVTTAARDYVFGLTRTEDEDDDVWAFALHLERQCDFFAGRSRPFGQGVLSRAQRVWQDDDAYANGSRPLARLCPALRPLAAVLASLSETSFRAHRLPRGAAFGSLTPASHGHLGWLPCAVVDAGCRGGLAIGTTFDPCEPRPLTGAYAALLQAEAHVREHFVDLVRTNLTSPADQHKRPIPSPQSPAQCAARALRKRPSAKRDVPDRPKAIHLFAACALGDPDLVEALVLRCRVKVDSRYPAEDPPNWAKLCPQQADAEPHEGTTALCFVVTWCDVLGEANVEKVARRLMLLRADPALDDGHPDVRFPPLCAAVANGSTQLALLLLHAGSEPDVRTSDGRQAIHVLNLTRKPEDRATLLEALVNAGADVNATTNSGDAACHVAAREGLHDLLCSLLQVGANMMLENGDGLTAAEVAYVELQGESERDGEALARCHALLA